MPPSNTYKAPVVKVLNLPPHPATASGGGDALLLPDPFLDLGDDGLELRVAVE